MDSSYAAAVPALDAYLFSICSVGTRFAIGLCFARLVFADFEFGNVLASQQRQAMSGSLSLAQVPLIVVPFSLIASLVAPFFPVQYSPSTQNDHRVVQNLAFYQRPLSVANWCRILLGDAVHSARSQGMLTRLRIQGISASASPVEVWLPPSRRTPCSVLPSPTSTTIPSSSWLADERSRNAGPSENHSGAHAARIVG